jgi:glycosyltransferase involved in cell wall biosynthesis
LTTSERSRARPRPSRAKLAIVTPWFSRELLGGAEQQSWQLAHQLATRGFDVEVLTTCCASFNDDWARNALPAGLTHSGEVAIRRFKVDKRDRRAFARVNAILTGLDRTQLKRGVSPIGDDDARIWEENNLNSRALSNHLEAVGHQFDAFIFMPYLYGTTLAGLPIVAERAFLQPCLHDEAYAYLPAVERVAHAARGILFNSAGEFELAQCLFGPGIIKKSAIVGQGVEEPANGDSPTTRIAHLTQDEDYVIYLGRQDSRKNIGLLITAFGDFRRRNPMSRLKLVLAGHRTMSFGDSSKGIIDIGPVSESEKALLLAHARALVQPSTMESYSRVIMESWMTGRPVIVNEECQATAPQVRQSGGGLLAGSVSSWENALHQIDGADASALDAMGRLGRNHALRYASWSRVIEEYERVLGFARGERLRLAPRTVPSLHQLCPGGATAARRFADSLDRCLQRERRESEPGPNAAGHPLESLLLVHQVCGFEDVTGWAPAHPNAALVYHAATGAGEPDESVCRSILSKATAHYKCAFGSSPRALEGLRAAGFSNPGLLPICVDPREWDGEEDRPLAKALQDGCTNLVYVGPMVSMQALDDLLTAFLHFLTLERDSRLALVGMGDVDDGIYERLQTKVRSLDLTDRVLVARDITGPQLQSVYRTAHLFWTLDESASFGESLLQAMWFDVPILAYKTPVSSCFTGGASLLLNDKDDLLAVAALAQMLVTDSDLRAKIVTAQRLVRERFDAVASVTTLLERVTVPKETVA